MKHNPLARNIRRRIKWSAFKKIEGGLKRRRKSPFHERRISRLLDAQLLKMAEMDQRNHD